LNNFGNGSASGTQSFNEDQMGEANLPPPDALQEFRVDSGGLSAEYKNVAAVTLLLKQGTNTYHGDAYGYLEDKALNANSFMLNATAQPRPPFHRDQFGADFGGPIKAERVVLFCVVQGHPREIKPRRQPGAALRSHSVRRFFGAVPDV
jgi:hypothetical protein